MVKSGVLGCGPSIKPGLKICAKSAWEAGFVKASGFDRTSVVNLGGTMDSDILYRYVYGK
ncbi:hypothetical protein A9K65_024875 [Mesorhizobium sp. WSM1497]|nr:hypothetical protein A4R29_10785 [Mesorhizobium ciceri biovar biserrulae]ARP66221.1 hypothetical protein A9K65_024875 [Mesorhizobium sp. WSM1497]